jgi:hypothetical protein
VSAVLHADQAPGTVAGVVQINLRRITDLTPWIKSIAPAISMAWV